MWTSCKNKLRLVFIYSIGVLPKNNSMIAVLFDIAITSIHIVYVIICICAKISNDISCASYYSAIINYTSALGRMQCPIKSYPWKGQAIAMLLTDQFSIYLCWDIRWTKRKMYPTFGCAFGKYTKSKSSKLQSRAWLIRSFFLD